MRWFEFSSLLSLALAPVVVSADSQQVIDDRLFHLRSGDREWSSFAEKPDSERLELVFDAKNNVQQGTLQLRQQDVKESWDVLLNERRLGRLVRDENDMIVYFEVPAGAVTNGKNILRIEQTGRGKKTPDDIRVGKIVLHKASRSQVLSESAIEIEVVDADTGSRLPARLTIINKDGALQTTGASSNDHLAVRTGTIYTSTGKAKFSLPNGSYTVFAGRGFEYSLDSAKLLIAAGETRKQSLSIRREVDTPGYVACDTHVHTLTHSGHGDSTVRERMITLAAEGIEFPIATDHNVHIDHNPFAREMHVRQYFTPVIGNEVTTRTGHFNVFPVRTGAEIPNYKSNEWKTTLAEIYRTSDVKVAILNHAHDIHSGVRPFGPKLFNDVVGENLDGWVMGFNAMEVVNSSANQTDAMQLFRDWMALLNRGRIVTPVGSSDSHDVARHFVGQGRTYIRCDDRDPGNIDVDAAVNSFVQGQVLVSYGLIAELTVNGKYSSGELAKVPGDELKVSVRVLGPHWVTANKLTLYMNGAPIRAVGIPQPSDDPELGMKFQSEWNLPKPKHDAHLVAIATGPGVDGLYWKTAKPYQPTSPEWTSQVIGCSGAVWLDVDGDGRRTAAYDYARRIVDGTRGDVQQLLTQLARYDQAVAAQTAQLLQSSGISLIADDVQGALAKSDKQVQDGFRTYLDAWRRNQIARSGD
jgi:hypothetical protein